MKGNGPALRRPGDLPGTPARLGRTFFRKVLKWRMEYNPAEVKLVLPLVFLLFLLALDWPNSVPVLLAFNQRMEQAVCGCAASIRCTAIASKT